MSIIQASGAVISESLQRATWLEISDGTIKSVNLGIHPAPDQVFDGVLIPGFVDIHCHGGGGSYFSAQNKSEIESAILAHRNRGTTSMMASLVSEPIESIQKQIARLLPFYESGEILGIHLEGPYLSPARCGAHDPGLLLYPVLDELKSLLLIGKGAIKMVTLAPELPGAIEAIGYLSNLGVIAAIGHTNGDSEDAIRAVTAGSTVVTHILNAMDKSLLEGSFGATLLADERVMIELILDGEHIPFVQAGLISKEIKSRLILITDAMAAAGSTDGNYSIGHLPVLVRGGVARISTTGALAGSTLTMDSVFKNCIREMGFSIPEAVAATSSNAAKIFGLIDCGDIAVGMRAHLLSYNATNASLELV
jgi:N-acetylglucosamine-6-phosphate deacetylase